MLFDIPLPIEAGGSHTAFNTRSRVLSAVRGCRRQLFTTERTCASLRTNISVVSSHTEIYYRNRIILHRKRSMLRKQKKNKHDKYFTLSGLDLSEPVVVTCRRYGRNIWAFIHNVIEKRFLSLSKTILVNDIQFSNISSPKNASRIHAKILTSVLQKVNVKQIVFNLIGKNIKDFP